MHETSPCANPHTTTQNSRLGTQCPYRTTPPPTPVLNIDDILQYPSDDEDDISTVGVLHGKPGKSLAEKHRAVAKKFKVYEAEHKSHQDKGKGKAV